MRSNRGGEFCSKDFEAFCNEQGILRHYTALYTPQKNGVVELRNRTIVAMARSILKKRHVPTILWGEAVRHAVYVLNKLPTRSLSSVTPHEAWFERKPSITSLRVFGCTTWMKVHAVNTTKLDDRSKLVVHFGRKPGTKAYRLFDPLTQSIHISRDIVFNEDNAWSWETTTNVDATEADKFTFVFPETDSCDSLTEPVMTHEDIIESPHTPLQQTPSSSQPNSADSGVPRDMYDDSVTPRRF